MPLAVHALTGALAAGAVALAASAGFRPSDVPPAILPVVAAALVLASLVKVEFQWGGDRESLDLFEAVLVPVIAAVPGAGAVLLVAVAKGAALAIARVAPVKTAFNVAQWSLAAAAADWTYTATRSGDRIDPVALAVAMVVALVVNHASLLVVLALAKRETVRSAFAGVAPIILAGWLVAGAANVSLGLLFAVALVHQASLAVLFLVPLLMFGWAQRAYGEVNAERARIEALQRSTHELARAADPADAIPAVLDLVRDAFAATAVALLVGDTVVGRSGDAPDALVRALAGAASSPGSERVAAGSTTPAAAHLRAAGHASALVAPLSADGFRVGTLVSIGRGGLAGFEAGEGAVLQAVAAEIAGALQRWELTSTLREERAHFAGIVASSSDGIFTLDDAGRVVDWNPAMAALTGVEASVAAGSTLGGIVEVRTLDGRPTILAGWAEADVASLPRQLRVGGADGKGHVLSCSYANMGGAQPHLLVVARDVTRERELDELRDNFAALASHEMRTPLASIIGFSNLLIDAPRPLTPEQQADCLARIRKGAHRLDRLVSNLLQLATIEARSDRSDEPLDLNAACAAAIEQAREAWPGREISLELATVGGGDVTAVGDALFVEQIVANLLSNACKYTEAPIAVRIARAGDMALVEVADGGDGIPPADVDRVFDRFYRSDREHAQAGAGLGLFIARQLAHALDGDLTLDNRPGRGATFCLSVPCAPATDQAGSLELPITVGA